MTKRILSVCLLLCFLVGCTSTIKREDIFLQAQHIKEEARLEYVKAPEIVQTTAPVAMPPPQPISAMPLQFTPLLDQEKLVYKIKYLGISIGDFTIINHGKTIYNGREAYSFEILVKALPFFIKIFNARDRYVSYMDAKDFNVLRSEEYVDGGGKLETTVDFNHQNHTATFKNLLTKRERVMPIPDKILDTVSGIFYLRMIPWELGDTAEINIYQDEKIYDCIGLLQSRPTVKISSKDIQQANLLKPYAFLDGKQVKEASGEVYFSTSAPRKTLRAVLKTIFGSVYVVLISDPQPS